jgi:hypothetical protein
MSRTSQACTPRHGSQHPLSPSHPPPPFTPNPISPAPAGTARRSGPPAGGPTPGGPAPGPGSRTCEGSWHDPAPNCWGRLEGRRGVRAPATPAPKLRPPAAASLLSHGPPRLPPDALAARRRAPPRAAVRSRWAAIRGAASRRDCHAPGLAGLPPRAGPTGPGAAALNAVPSGLTSFHRPPLHTPPRGRRGGKGRLSDSWAAGPLPGDGRPAGCPGPVPGWGGTQPLQVGAAFPRLPFPRTHPAPPARV